MVMRRSALFLSEIAVAAMLWGCGPHVAGGDVTETGNAVAIRITVVDTGKNAMSNAKVSLFQFDEKVMNRPIPVDSTLVTDANGNVVVQLKSNRKYAVECFDSHKRLVAYKVILAQPKQVNTGGVDQFVFVDTLTSDSLDVAVAPWTQYNGVVMGGMVAKVILAGTPYSTGISVNGEFSFDSIPQGPYTVEFETGDSQIIVVGSRLITSAGASKIDTVVLDKNAFVIEDFEERSNVTSLWACFGGSWWDVVHGTDMDTTKHNQLVISPASTQLEVFKNSLVDTGIGAHGYYVTVNYTVDTGRSKERTYCYAGLKQWIGNGRHHLYNFADVDSLSFRAKGNGAIRIELVQEVFDSLQLKMVVGERFVLDTNWNVYTVRLKAKSVPQDDSLYQELLWPYSDYTSVDSAGYAASDWATTLGIGGYSAHLGLCSDWSLPPYITPPGVWGTGKAARDSWALMQGRVNQMDFLADSGTWFSLDDIKVYGTSIDNLAK